MIGFLIYYILGCLVFLTYLKFSKETREMFNLTRDSVSESSLALTLWTYPLIWPIDVGFDLYRYFVKKVPLEDL